MMDLFVTLVRTKYQKSFRDPFEVWIPFDEYPLVAKALDINFSIQLFD